MTVLRERRLAPSKVAAHLDAAIIAAPPSAAALERFERLHRRYLHEAVRGFRPPTPPPVHDPLAEQRALLAEQDAQYAAALQADQEAEAAEAAEEEAKVRRARSPSTPPRPTSTVTRRPSQVHGP